MNARREHENTFPAMALIAALCLSLLVVPLAVQASPYDKSVGKSPDPPYLAIGNGVLVSTFTRDVPGIQGAVHVVTLTSSGLRIGGWM